MSEPRRAQPNSGSDSPPAAPDNLPDVLAYLADMIGELEVMADQTRCQTLTGLLSLAQAEARLQRAEAIRTRAG